MMQMTLKTSSDFDRVRLPPVASERARDLALRVALFLSASLFLPVPGVASSSTAPMPRPTGNVAEQYLLNAANQERAARGLQQLRNDPVLARAARFHALQMAQHAGISHQFPGEPELSERGSACRSPFLADHRECCGGP